METDTNKDLPPVTSAPIRPSEEVLEVLRATGIALRDLRSTIAALRLPYSQLDNSDDNDLEKDSNAGD